MNNFLKNSFEKIPRFMDTSSRDREILLLMFQIIVSYIVKQNCCLIWYFKNVLAEIGKCIDKESAVCYCSTNNETCTRLN